MQVDRIVIKLISVLFEKKKCKFHPDVSGSLEFYPDLSGMVVYSFSALLVIPSCVEDHKLLQLTMQSTSEKSVT